MPRALSAWLELGADRRTAAALARAGLRPVWGGDEFDDAFASWFNDTWLNMVDTSGATVDGTPFDQVFAVTAAGGTTYEFDAAGNVYDAHGTMIMSADQVNAVDPQLRADLMAYAGAESALGGSFANADGLGGAGGAGQAYYYDPTTGGIVDANGTQVASAYDLQQAGINPADLAQGDPMQGQTGGTEAMMGANGWGTSPAGITIDAQGNAIDAQSGQQLASAAELQAAGVNPATMTGAQLDAAFGASPGGGDPAAAGARAQGLTSDYFANNAPTTQAGVLPYLRQALEAAGVPAGLVNTLAASLATLGVSGAGLLAGQLLAGGTQRYTPTLASPTVGHAIADAALQQPQNAQAMQDIIGGSLAGQRNLVDWTNQNQGAQLPAYGAIQDRSLAAILQNMPGMVAADPATTALRERLMQALTGQDNPALTRAFAEQTETMRNLGAIRGGPGGAGSYFQSTPGIEAATKVGESQGIQRYQDYLNTITSLNPQYNQARTTDQNINSQQLNQRVGLAGLQPTAPTTLASLYNQYTPVSQISGYGSNVSGTNANILNQAALASIQAQQLQRQNLANQVGQLVGRVGTSLVTGQPNL